MYESSTAISPKHANFSPKEKSPQLLLAVFLGPEARGRGLDLFPEFVGPRP